MKKTKSTQRASALLAAAMQWAEGTKEHAQHCALDKDRRWLSERGIQRVSENNGDIAARVLAVEIRRLRGAIEYIDRQVRECWPVTGSVFSDVHRQWCIKVAREALFQNTPVTDMEPSTPANTRAQSPRSV